MSRTTLIAVVAFSYLALLFVIAFVAERRARAGRSMIGGPHVYALSLAVYCSAMTLYGSIGFASTKGTVVLALFLGPTLAAAAWWVVPRKVLRIAKKHHITSIADFIAARYGKSATLGAVVSLICLVGLVPYIALELKAVSVSLGLLERYPLLVMPALPSSMPIYRDSGLYVSVVLAVFVIAFGTRHLDTTERHEGMVATVAFESVVKLTAFAALGGFVVYGLYDGLADLFVRAGQPWLAVSSNDDRGKWQALLLLSMLGFLLLPRQFQMAVVENVDERHLARASWLVPLYLLAFSAFIVPIAFAGLVLLPGGAIDADMFALALPMTAEHPWLALFIFVGGLSAATAMMIVEAIALSTMLTNSVIVPALLRASRRLPAWSASPRMLVNIRRGTIAGILMAGYYYYRQVGEWTALVSMGLVTLAAIAQIAPSFIGGLYWKQGSRQGALAGMGCGMLLWFYTLLLPYLVQAQQMVAPNVIIEGLFGYAALRPTSLFGLGDGLDLISHGVLWSLLVNVGMYVWVSLFSRQTALDQIQALRFVEVFNEAAARRASRLSRSTIPGDQLDAELVRFLGPERAQAFWEDQAQSLKWQGRPPAQADADLVAACEDKLAGAIGSASARIVVDSLGRIQPGGFEDVMWVLDEASQAIHHSHELERKSSELEATAALLRENQERFRDLAESASDWFWETDAEHRFTFVSEHFAEATGVPTSEVLGKARWELLDPKQAIANAEKWREHREQLAAHQPFRRFEYDVQGREGRTVNIRITGKPFFDPSGQFVGYRGTGTDITVLVQAQAELLRTEKLVALGSLVAGVAHEINTPVGIGLTAASHLDDVVKRFEQVFAADKVKRSDLQRLLSTAAEMSSSILSNLRRAADLVRSFKQAAVDQSSDQKRRFNLKSYLEEIIRSLQPQIARAGHTVGVDCPDDLELNSFPGAYWQITTNLVMNSLVHGFDGMEHGRIEIVVSSVEGQLQLRYSDDGAGIAEHVVPHLFQPFFTTKRNRGGSGLGLYLVHSLVTQSLGGRIDCLTGQAKGASFLIRVPLDKVDGP